MELGMRVLVTGAAGFIGRALCERLLQSKSTVVGIDNLNDYYDPKLKISRLRTLSKFDCFTFKAVDLVNSNELNHIFSEFDFEYVVNLAAQAGVRHSIVDPQSYTASNLVGFFNLLECCRNHHVKHLIFASSSSVYGRNKKVPFSEEDRVDLPVSYYAATKKAGEVMAASYSSLYKIPCSGLRFFTVYGPWGRPDMAPWIFTEAILKGKEIRVFNYGDMLRDFTYIDDIITGVVALLPLIPKGEPPFEIFNIGNNRPERLSYFINCIEEACGKKAKKIMLPMQQGDVPVTYADIEKIKKAVGFQPETQLHEGIQKFVDWYKKYYSIGS